MDFLEISTNEFDEIVNRTFLSIPKEFRDKLENVTILTQDFPSEFQLEKLKNIHGKEYLLGLYEGTPYTKRGFYNASIPDKITLFRLPITRICSTINEVEEVVYNTILHEIGHYFGMNEEEVRKAERSRYKRLRKSYS